MPAAPPPAQHTPVEKISPGQTSTPQKPAKVRTITASSFQELATIMASVSLPTAIPGYIEATNGGGPAEKNNGRRDQTSLEDLLEQVRRSQTEKILLRKTIDDQKVMIESLQRTIADNEAVLAIQQRLLARLEQSVAALANVQEGKTPTIGTPKAVTLSDGLDSSRHLQASKVLGPILLCFLPRITFIGPSLKTIFRRIPDPRGLMQLLIALDRGESFLADGKVNRVPAYFEKRFTIGAGGRRGRLYFARASGGVYLVLVTVKYDDQSQERDIEILQRHPVK